MFSAEALPPSLKGVGITEKLGSQLPMTLQIVNQDGVVVSLNHAFRNGRPVILNLAYYSCPMLCHLVANGLVDSLKQAYLKPGKDFDIISISFDSHDTIQNAKDFSSKYRSMLGLSLTDPSWQFYVASENVIKQLTSAVGFNFYEKEGMGSDRFAHSSGIFILTPEGKVSRYFYGISYPSFDLKMALTEAKLGKQKSTVDKVLLFCYNYDPHSRKYILYAMNLMRVGAVLAIIFVVGIILIFRRKR